MRVERHMKHHHSGSRTNLKVRSNAGQSKALNRDSRSRQVWEGGRESGDSGRAPQELLHVQENKAAAPRGNSIHSLPPGREEPRVRQERQRCWPGWEVGA